MKNIEKLLLLILLFVLSSCADSYCIDADDFGFSHVNVPASYNTGEVLGSDDKQYAPWVDSGLTLSGGNVHMVVKYWDKSFNINTQTELSAWCPWLGPAENPPSLAPICLMLPDCQFDSSMCVPGDKAPIMTAPCILRKGIGLYYMLAPKDFNPNASERANRTPHLVDPRVVVGHMGDKQKGADGQDIKFYDLLINPREVDATKPSSKYMETGGMMKELDPGQKANLYGGKLYFKIMDSYYNDNSGQYIVTIKKGVTNTEWDPTGPIVDMIKEFFFGKKNNYSPSNLGDSEIGIVGKLFTGVVSKPSYKMSVSALLSMAIIFYAFNFMVGNVQVTHRDLLVKIVKIIIISQLLTSETAWVFFNQYLFSFFIDGSEEMINIIKEAGGSGPGASTIISFMFAPNTFIKLMALPWVGNVGTFFASILYIILYIIAAGIIVLALLYSGIVYITCLVMMGLLISLAPIFLCFLLFEKTAGIFENWLRQIASFALQSLLVVAAVTMFGLMIKHQIYATLGFRVCQFHYLSAAGTEISRLIGGNANVDIENSYDKHISGKRGRSASPYVYIPKFDSNEQAMDILIPEAHYEGASYSNSGAQVGRFCEAYECKGRRYPSFPFLDPNPDPNNSDYLMLQDFWQRRFAPLSKVLALMLTGVLLSVFLFQAIKIGKYITGGVTDISDASYNSTVETTAAAYTTAKNTTKIAGYAAIGAGKGIANIRDEIKRRNAAKNDDVSSPASSKKGNTD
jgi:type IV secretion system protein VirB6